jgi:hypothetical protein
VRFEPKWLRVCVTTSSNIDVETRKRYLQRRDPKDESPTLKSKPASQCEAAVPPQPIELGRSRSEFWANKPPPWVFEVEARVPDVWPLHSNSGFG